MQIKLWLEAALADENLEDFSVDVSGTSQKGDGYLGDIVFVDVVGTTKSGETKTYNLVLKCSKNSEALRSNAPTKELFENEIYFYSEILPAFRKFQESKGIDNTFNNSVPRYYGHFLDQTHEIIVLENIKEAGYELHDMKEPLSRNQLLHVLEQYAKFHAISAAFSDQNPREFEALANGTVNVFDMFNKFVNMNIPSFFRPVMEETYNLLKDELTEDACNRWLNLIDRISPAFADVLHNETSFRVLSHGDCWNNNFMFKNEKSQSGTIEAMILDWQLTSNLPPVRDLSYFMYTCISKEDLIDFDEILKHYYRHFANYVQKLGSDSERIYPFTQLLTDWKRFSCHSLLYTSGFAKIAATEKDDLPDFAETAEQGKNMAEAFQYEIKNKELFKQRMKYIIEHAVEKQFI